MVRTLNVSQAKTAHGRNVNPYSGNVFIQNGYSWKIEYDKSIFFWNDTWNDNMIFYDLNIPDDYVWVILCTKICDFIHKDSRLCLNLLITIKRSLINRIKICHIPLTYGFCLQPACRLHLNVKKLQHWKHFLYFLSLKVSIHIIIILHIDFKLMVMSILKEKYDPKRSGN